MGVLLGRNVFRGFPAEMSVFVLFFFPLHAVDDTVSNRLPTAK